MRSSVRQGKFSRVVQVSLGEGRFWGTHDERENALNLVDDCIAFSFLIFRK